MQIQKVKSSRDLKEFILFPYKFYKNDPVWVPPLRSELKAQFNPRKNPFLDHCVWQLFLLKQNSKVVGRIAAFIDTIAIDSWKERVGFFGYFECIEDESASNMLLQAARAWLNDMKCTSMRGPWSFVAEEWGMVTEGFTPSAVVMSPYNPPYYNSFMSAFGLKKLKDLLCWEISIADGYKIPDRIMNHTDKVAERYGITIRQLNMKDFENEVELFTKLSNECLIQNWGFTHVTEAEADAMAKNLKRVLQAKGVLFAQDSSGRHIGFALVIPDINFLLKGLNGRLFPFGFIKLLFGIPRLRRYRMFGLGVIPEYQRKGVDSLIYKELNNSLHAKDLWIEINYVLEDNVVMVNAINKLNAKPSRRFRIYEMKI